MPENARNISQKYLIYGTLTRKNPLHKNGFKLVTVRIETYFKSLILQLEI